jgi:hypothetical protein
MYIYALNNPLKFIDPTGTACVYAGADNGTWDDYNDQTNYINDNNGGQSCADAFASPPQQVTVNDSYNWLNNFSSARAGVISIPASKHQRIRACRCKACWGREFRHLPKQRGAAGGA